MKVSDFAEKTVYLDTNFIYFFVRPIPEYKQEILSFFNKIEEGKILAYTCINTFDELAYRLLLAFIKDKHDGNPIDLLRKHTQNMLEEFYPKIQNVLISLKSFPNFELLPLTSNELTFMIHGLTHIKLLPRDALHFASMKNHGIRFIASDDRDFDRIESIERVWLFNPPIINCK